MVFILVTSLLGSSFPAHVRANENVGGEVVANTETNNLSSPDGQASSPISSDTETEYTQPSDTETKSLEDIKNDAEPSALNASTGSQKSQEKINYTPTFPKVDTSTGSLTFDVPITVPAGRGGATPTLALHYRSQQTKTFNGIGRGWSLGIPEIKRVNATGSQNLFLDDVFESSLSGKLVFSQTETDGSKTFAPRIEGPDKLSYRYWDTGETSRWLVQDNKGMVYAFGTTAASRQDDPGDPMSLPPKKADPKKIFSWKLDTLSDANENSVRYFYRKDNGQVLVDRITYPHHPSVSTPPPFEIRFSWEDHIAAPPTFDTGFRVVNSSLLNQVEVRVKEQVSRSYRISRTVAVSTSLVSRITESYRDEAGAMIDLPPMKFTYPTVSESSGWDPAPTWQFMDVTAQQSGGGAVRALEVNGDGLTDFLIGTKIFRNTGRGYWEQVPAQVGPRAYTFNNSDELLDFDGDGLSDYFSVYGYPTPVPSFVFPSRFYRNTNGTYVEETNYSLPPQVYMNHYFSGQVIDNGGVRTLDVNGDGRVDILQGLKFTTATASPKRYYVQRLHSGVPSGPLGYEWREVPWSRIPIIEADPLTDNITVDDATVLNFADVNGDNLVDIIRWASPFGEHALSTFKVDFNNGSGWSLSDYVPVFFNTDIRSDQMLTADVNGDGIEDLLGVKKSCTPTCGYLRKVFLGTGVGYVDASASWNLPQEYIFSGQSVSRPTIIVADVNGDGAVDLLLNSATFGSIHGKTTVFLNKSAYALLPKTIELPTGATVDITYNGSPSLVRPGTQEPANPRLPLALKVVTQVTTNVNGQASSETFNYEDGVLSNFTADVSDVRYRGDRFPAFGKTTLTSADGTKTVTYNHQGNGIQASSLEAADHHALINRPYRQDILDKNNVLLRQTLTRYQVTNLSGAETTGHWFVSPLTIVTTDVGEQGRRSTAELFAYQATTGNLLRHYQLGEVRLNADGNYDDIGSDTLIVTLTYANWIDRIQISAFPSSKVITDGAHKKVSETQYNYDGLTSGRVARGNVTKTAEWITASRYANTFASYDALGNVSTAIAPNGGRTTTTYDENKMYPASVTNAIGHQTLFEYDLACGLPGKVSNSNGTQTRTTYDGLCRVVKEFVSDPALSYVATRAPLVTKRQFVYVNKPQDFSIRETKFLDKTMAVELYTYLDGLGRAVQTRRSSQTPNVFVVADTHYDSLGRVSKQSLPYFSSGSSVTVSTNNEALYTSYTYDSLGRIVTEKNSLGTAISSYQVPWEVSVVDAKGRKKIFTKDALGRLTTVTEVNVSQEYKTTYTYDALGNLIGIVDAEGNVRSFTYDALGRRLSVEDLHRPGDTTFGTWRFMYDSSGNVVRREDPMGQVIFYKYDVLNRIMSEDYTGKSGIEITYSYDTCLNGKGYLCSVKKSDFERSYEYNAVGQVIRDVSIIGGQSYATRQGFDRQGNLRHVETPDDARQVYVYNAAGLLENVSTAESGASLQPLILKSVYGPHDLLTEIQFSNGVVAYNTYDTNKRYRLSRQQTIAPSGSASTGASGPIVFGQRLVDNSYTYDAVGNILSIVDDSDTNTKKVALYTYDDLDRLRTARVLRSRNSAWNYTESYTYSPTGNILTKTRNGQLVLYCYGGGVAHGACAPSNPSGTWANPQAATKIGTAVLTYDKNGNQTTDGPVYYRWDYNNRLLESGGDGQTMFYGYDQGGERVSTKVGEVTTFYPNQWYNASTAGKIVKHVFAGDAMLATVEGSGANAAVYMQSNDHLLSAGVTTNSAGGVVEVSAYSPYGEPTIADQTGTFTEQRKYIGQEYDQESGLSYLHARYYNPKTARFLSQDPAAHDLGRGDFEKQYGRSLALHLSNPQSLNHYSYAENNPLTKKDASGKFALAALAGLWAAAETALTAYDVYDTHQTFSNPNSSNVEKGISVVGLAIGAGIPGGGYGIAGKQLAKKAGDVTDAVKAGLNLTKREKEIVHHAYAPHAVKEAEWGNPAITVPEFVERLRDIQKNFDIKATVHGMLKNGSKIDKQYLGNTKTNEIRIFNSNGSPTFFVVKNGVVDYMRRALKNDFKRYGKR